MLKEAGGTKELFIEWAKLSPKYDANDMEIKRFDNVGDDNYNALAFLRKFAKISHPDFFNTDKIIFGDFFNPNYGQIEIIIETSQFVIQCGTEFENDIKSNNKIIIIKADLGAGKFTAIKRILSKHNSFLIITPRIVYCKHAVKEFGVVSYLEGSFDVPMLACSGIDTSQFECVILDECEAILSIFSSSTLQRRQLITFDPNSPLSCRPVNLPFLMHYIEMSNQSLLDNFKSQILLSCIDGIFSDYIMLP
jgi:hypothetical protein